MRDDRGGHPADPAVALAVTVYLAGDVCRCEDGVAADHLGQRIDGLPRTSPIPSRKRCSRCVAAPSRGYLRVRRFSPTFDSVPSDLDLSSHAGVPSNGSYGELVEQAPRLVRADVPERARQPFGLVI